VFEILSERLDKICRSLRSRGVIREKDLEGAFREVKLALLEADVNYRVVKEFLDRVRTRAIGLEVVRGISPGQQVIKIVHGELACILGNSNQGLKFSSSSPTIILLVGLQGSGKTTTAAKLARILKKQGKRPCLIAADVYRPAAVEQLTVLSETAGVPMFSGDGEKQALNVVSLGMERAAAMGADVVIIDSAGRLHCDREMIGELREVVNAVRPEENLLVVDGMTGQEAVNIAQTFHREIGLTGIILTKMEGDARGGALLSIYSVTDCPIKFIGTGEGIDDLEIFHPERMASRILNMGDVLTLVEKARRSVEGDKVREMEEKLRGKGEFDLEDFMTSIHQLQRMGPLNQLLEMIPGLKPSSLAGLDMDSRRLSRVEAIILSMTPKERRNPEIMNGSRRLRVASGSGTTVREVNQLINQFRDMKRLFKARGRQVKRRLAKKEIGLWR
jgi:signal recognition particle subunit SRP54